MSQVDKSQTCAKGLTSPLRVDFLLKTDSGYRRDAEVTLFTRQTLRVSFALTPIGQLQQSPPSPVPGDRARGKRKGFSPGAAARHRSPTRVPTDLKSTFFSVFLILYEIGRLLRVFAQNLRSDIVMKNLCPLSDSSSRFSL